MVKAAGSHVTEDRGSSDEGCQNYQPGTGNTRGTRLVPVSSFPQVDPEAQLNKVPDEVDQQVEAGQH